MTSDRSRGGRFDTKLPASPYPGLRPFEPEEWAVFFGRERTSDEVIERMTGHGLVVVHGSSGCGKSSLIRAGVMVRLRQEHERLRLRWDSSMMRPGDAPLRNLAVALSEATAEGRARFLDVRRLLNQGKNAADALARFLQCGPEHTVCLLIDQFEEIFRFGRERNHEEMRLFTDFLVGLEQSKPEGFQAIVTMRSDFLGNCADLPGLAETVDRTAHLLPRMASAELMRAIREPARLYGCNVTEELADRLILDAAITAGDQLPLIQHSLRLLWSEAGVIQSDTGASARSIDLPMYLRSGRLRVQLSTHADRIMDEAAPEPADALVVEHIFRALTDLGAAGNAIRRPQRFGDLVEVTGADPARLAAIIGPFRRDGASFLTPYAPSPVGDDTVIDISHEALIRCWAKIADPRDGWLQSEFRDGEIWRASLVHAKSYEADASNTLTPAMTEERENWLERRSAPWARRYGGGWDRVRRLVSASRDTIVRERAERQRVRRLRRTIIGLSIALVVGFGTWALVTHFSDRAGIMEASRAQARLLTRLSREASRQGNFDSAARFALAALDANPGEAPSPETESALRSAAIGRNVGFLARARANALLVLSDGWVVSAEKEGNQGGVLRLWNPDDPEAPVPLGSLVPEVRTLTGLPDGRVVSGDASGRLLLWERLIAGRRSLDDRLGDIVSVGQLPEGRIVVAFNPRESPDESRGSPKVPGSLKIIDVENRTPPVGAPLDRRITAMAAKRGEFVIGLDRDPADPKSRPRLVRWHPDRPRQTSAIVELEAAANSIAFVTDDLVVVDDTAGDVSLWDITSGQKGKVRAQCPSVKSISCVLPDRRIVIGDESGKVYVWNPDPQTIAYLCQHDDEVLAMAVLHDGRVVSAGGNRILMSDPTCPGEGTELLSLDCGIGAMAALPSGGIRISGETGAKIWSPAGVKETVIPGDAKTAETASREGETPLRALAALANEQVVVGRSGDIGVWRLGKEWSNRLSTLSESVTVRALAVLHDGRVVIGGVGGVEVWDPRGGSPTARTSYDVIALAALEDGRIAMSGDDNAIVLCDLVRDSRRLTILGINAHPVVALAAIGNTHVISGDGAGLLNMWDVDVPGGSEPFGVHDGLTTLVTLPDGRIVSGGSDGRVLVWNPRAHPDVAQLRDELRSRLRERTQLTTQERLLAARR